MDDKIWSERWRLARLDRPDLIRAALWAAMIGLVFVLFHLQGNTTDTNRFGRSAVLWMIGYWNDSALVGDNDYSHGWLIVPAAIFLVWRSRDELRAATRSTSTTGLALIVLALFMHWVGAKAQQTRLSLMALALLLWALPYYFYGWRVAKKLLFPCAFLGFCIPLNFLDGVTVPLRKFAAFSSEILLNGFGCAVTRTGTQLKLAGSESALEVAGPCSGIRSLFAMAALTAFYGHLTQRTLMKKWVLFVSALPLAIIGNIARITTVGLVQQAFGPKVAETYHDYSGYLSFAIVVGLMITIGRYLELGWRELWERWRHALFGPSLSPSPS